MGKSTIFDWAIFHGKLLVITRGYHLIKFREITIKSHEITIKSHYITIKIGTETSWTPHPLENLPKNPEPCALDMKMPLKRIAILYWPEFCWLDLHVVPESHISLSITDY